jgi:photosystem II stability/assembly factor-like uncharacterized protein
MEVAGDRVFAVGERGLIIFSDDGGESWRQAQVPVSQTLTAVSFPSPNLGWAVGHGGVILHSEDRGETWELQFDGESANQQWLGYTRGRQIAMEQRVANAAGSEKEDLEYELEDIVYEVEDTELALKSGPADPFLDVLFIDEERGWAVGAYGLLFETFDGGEQWELAVSGIENHERYHYYKITANEDDQLFLVGEAGIIYRSDNEGENWQRLPLDYDGSLFGVLTLGSDTVVCFGLRGNIFRSNDNGMTWSTILPEPNPALSFFGGTLLENGSMVLVGAGGGMASSSDLGLTFGSEVHSSRNTFSAVHEVDSDLLLVGMSGLVRIPAARGGQ